MRRPLLRRFAPRVLAAFTGICASAPVVASADPQVCASCEACTTALAAPGARVELGSEIAAVGDVCVVIRGEGALFDGLDHAISAKGTSKGGAGVRVQARGAVVRNVRVSGADVGVLIAAPDVTLFHATLEAKRVGVQVEASEGFRLSRSHVKGGQIGVSFGARDDGTCADGAAVASPGAVVNGTYVENAGVGIAACDAIPVLTRNTLIRNGVGLLLGDPAVGAGPKGAPYDACLCAPWLSGVKPATTLFFTTGCSACEVHEAWMPELKRAKHAIRERETGREKLAIAAKFDAFLDRCAPQVTDVLGISGCVPNYTCLANDVTVKTRAGDDTMTTTTQIQSPDDVARFATECAAAAAKGYRDGPSCVARALSDNVVCGSKRVDIKGGGPAKKAGGAGNACGAVEGWADEGATGCASPCPASLPAPPEPITRAKKAATGAVATAAPPPVPPPAVAEAPPANAAPSASAAAPSDTDAARTSGTAGGEGTPAMMWIVGGAGALGGLFFLSKLLGGAKAPAPAKAPSKPSGADKAPRRRRKDASPE